MKQNLTIASVLLSLIVILGATYTVFRPKATIQSAELQAPRFEVDPLWPKPLPNHWLLGMVIGLSIDDKDHIWVVHRGNSLEPTETHMESDPDGSCCKPAPPVLKFDEEGNLIGHWGGPGEGYDWPLSMHGILADYKGNVWLGGNGAGGAPGATTGGPFHDDMILKFTQDGKFLVQIGKPNQSKGSNDTDNVKGVSMMLVDSLTNELYAADGYGNKRVIVFDAETGKVKRYWGAYGHRPDDTDMGPYNPAAPPDQQFRNPVHCVALSVDRILYVCDRVNDRIQMFQTDGTFMKEVFVHPEIKGNGSVWGLAFSKDPQQTYMYLADGALDQVHILLRRTLQVLTSFGDGGRQPGQFYAVHCVETDSKGNLFTGETFRGQRVQKFIYKGMAPVTKENQGVVWPKSAKSPM